MATVTAHIYPDRPIGRVAPEFHGHFVEQLFDCVNDGLFDRATGAFRPYFVEKAAALGLELIRWPGGCFADAYHWRNGIGPQNQRPRTVTNRWGVDEIETHHVGSHEFLEFCRLTGARPWINLNVATGSPREAAEWFEYLTLAEGSDLAELRAKNGRPDAFTIDLWGIGNECWDCGGKFTPTEYAHAYRRFESAIPRLRGVPRHFVIGGPDGNKSHEREIWTRETLARLHEWRKPAAYALDLHFYTWGEESLTGRAAVFDAAQFTALLARGLELEPVLIRQREIIDEFDPELKLMVGEWGPWHPDANGNRFFQPVTGRDAVLAAATLDMFHRHANKLAACTYTMLCNVLGAPFQTRGGEPYVTPVYHVFALHRGHRGGMSLACEVAGDPLLFANHPEQPTTPPISLSATQHEAGLYVTLANLNPAVVQSVELVLPAPVAGAAGQVMGADDPQATNAAGRERFALHPAEVQVSGSRVRVQLPPAGVIGLQMSMGA